MPSKRHILPIPQTNKLLLQPGEFQNIYEQYHLIVFRYLYGLHGGPTEEVEDLTTAVFLRAWKSRHRFRGNHKAALGWLIKIARNLVIDSYRRKGRSGSLIDIENQIIPSNDLSPEECFFLQDQIATLWKLLTILSPQQREIIVFRYILGWRVKDIAKQLNKSENNISVSIRRILKHLQNEWPIP
jgi:RNA polymerase sigma-70 factor (ECF subfamily)